MAKSESKDWGNPSVVVRSDEGSLSYFPEAGVIRCEGPDVDFTIPEVLFGSFLTQLKRDADAVANGLVKNPDETRVDVEAPAVLDPPAL